MGNGVEKLCPELGLQPHCPLPAEFSKAISDKSGHFPKLVAAGLTQAAVCRKLQDEHAPRHIGSQEMLWPEGVPLQGGAIESAF